MWTQWRKWIVYPISWLVFVGIVLLVVNVASGMGTTPPMDAFRARYEAVRHDDRVELHVTERISLELQGDRGIDRDLMTKYGDTDVTYSDITVDQSGPDDVEYEVNDQDNGDIRISIGGEDRKWEDVTYIVSYVIDNVAVGDDEYQELYFNTNGTGWNNGFVEFEATLTLDESLRGATTGDSACYVGKAGSTERCSLSGAGERYHTYLIGRASGGLGLGPYENVTIAVDLENGTVSDPLPPPPGASHGWMGIAILVAIGAVPLVVALIVRAILGNLKYGEQGVVTQFEPPERLIPLLAADFLGHPERGAAAHLTDLVVRGRAELHTPHAPIEARDDDKVEAHRISTMSKDLAIRWDDEHLRSHERRITDALFDPPGRANRVYAKAYGSSIEQAQEVRDRELEYLGLRRHKDLSVPILFFGLLGIFGYGAYQMWVGLADVGWWFVLAGVVACMLLVWGVHLMPVHFGLTAKGKEVRRHLMGLHRFISTAEADRISWLQNAASAPRDEEGRLWLYERLLPWAIVFGEEKTWVGVVGDMTTRLPAYELRLPDLAVVPGLSEGYRSRGEDYYRRRRRVAESGLKHRHDFGQGTLATGFSDFREVVSDSMSGRSSGSWSSRSGGRGWRGGGGGSRGSRGGGRSGGGVGGGGGGRR